MSGPRETAVPPPVPAMPAGATPYGYDRTEFAPEECTRDFRRPRKVRMPDEERRLLREVTAAFGDADAPDAPHRRAEESGPVEDTPADDPPLPHVYQG